MRLKFILVGAIVFIFFSFFIYYLLADRKTNSFLLDDFENLDKQLEKDPKNGILYYKKALYLLKNKRYDEVFKNCSKAIEIGFPVFDCYILMSISSYENKNYNLQKYYATLALERDPTSYEGYLMRARSYYYLGEYSKAVNDFETAYNIVRDDDILFEIALVYYKMNKYTKALKILRDLHLKYPQNLNIINSLIDIYREIKFYNNSLFFIEKLCSIRTITDIDCRKKKIDILYEMGDYEYALIECKKILKVDKNFNKPFYCKLLIKNGFVSCNNYMN